MSSQGLLDLYSLKHQIIDLGTDIEKFHASEDRQAVRDLVFDTIKGLQDARVDTVVVEKRKAAPSIRPLKKFYPMMVENLLKYPSTHAGWMRLDSAKYSSSWTEHLRAPQKERP